MSSGATSPGSSRLRPSPVSRGSCATCGSTETNQARVIDFDATVHDDGKPVLSGVVRRLFVDDAGLHPQHLRAGGDGVLCHGHELLAAPENIHYVHLLGDVFNRRVRLFAEDLTTQVGVDGEHPVAEALQSGSDRVARAVWPV